MNRPLNALTPLGDALRFDSLTGREELSRLFEFSLTLKSEQRDIDPDALLGQSLSVEIQTAAGVRYLNGQCARFTHLGPEGRLHRYEARLRPWLWYATRRSDCRIFQHKSIPDIVKEVLARYPFDVRFTLTRGYRNWDYCVQYRETDANFVMRLLEHEGIWFWFEHSAGEHTLVLSDEIGTASPFPGYASIPYYSPDQTYPDTDHLDGWADGGRVKSGSYLARDYNFEMPSADLTTSRATPAGHPHASYDIFDWPGGYQTLAEGDPYARMRIEELQSAHHRDHGQGRARGLAPGRLFTLEKHPRAICNREYLIVAADYHFADNDYEARSQASSHTLRIAIETHATDRPFRPQRLTPKPHTLGPESAVVVGPAGQEIYTDNHGRVKVQFHWDRYGKKDQNSSCWIRVSHPWAGAGFGGIHVPRIGQEVLVDHLNGDPDLPIITSRVYNAEQTPPWELPGNATQSGFLTRSSLGGTAANANAFRFEDKKGAEQVWLHAERNQDIEVEVDETHWVGNDRTKTIDGNETVTVHKNRTETVDLDETITVHENRTETVDGNETITIHKNRTETVDKNEKISIGQNRTEDVGQNETISIGSNKKETIGLTYRENTGIAKMMNIGMAYSRNVGVAMNSLVGMMQASEVGLTKKLMVGQSYTADIGKTVTLTVGDTKKEDIGKTSIHSVGEHFELVCGKAKIVLKSDGGIFLQGTHIELQGQEAINGDAGRIQWNCDASEAPPKAPAGEDQASEEQTEGGSGAPAGGAASPAGNNFVAAQDGAAAGGLGGAASGLGGAAGGLGSGFVAAASGASSGSGLGNVLGGLGAAAGVASALGLGGGKMGMVSSALNAAGQFLGGKQSSGGTSPNLPSVIMH